MYSLIFKVGVVSVFYVFFTSSGILGQTAQDVSMYAADVESDKAYCFRFTWLGPLWDNSSQVNGTCEDFGQVPCKEPLIYTVDATPPNTTYMWYNYDLNQIACRLTNGEVCTKWTKYYGDEVEFITYMCSKYTVNGKAEMNYEGCESDSTTNDTFINEVCACRSGVGVKPCNAATHMTPLTLLLLVGLFAVLSFRALSGGT